MPTLLERTDNPQPEIAISPFRERPVALLAVETDSPRRVYVPPQPMMFEEFLDSYGEDDDIELIDGVVVEKMSAQLDHERLFGFLFRLLSDFADAKDLGIILGSRTAVKINDFRGRIPDVLFVRKENLGIVESRSIYGAPDLIVEIVSEWDRPSDLRALETDYRNLDVTEIVFVDPQKRTVRFLRKDSVATGGYADITLGASMLTFSTLPGLSFDVAHLWSDPLPKPSVVLASLIAPDEKVS